MKEETITGRQLISLVIMAQLGTEVMSLPHVEADIAGHDTWLTVLLSGLAAQIGIILIWWLGSRYPNRNLFSYTSLIAGRPIGICVNLLYGCYYAISGYLITMSYIDILKRWLFMFTPKWLLILMLLIACGYAATLTLRRLAFLSQSFMFLPVIGFILIVFSTIYGLDVRNLLPVLSDGWLPVFKGVYAAFTAYVGYDLLLYAFPYVKTRNRKKLLLAMTIANGCTMIYYVTVCLVCTTMFGLKQLLVIPEPIVFILKNYRVDILQSIDILFLFFYVFVAAATIYVYFFLAAKAFQHLRGQGLGNQKIWVWAIAGLCFVGGFFISKRNDILRIAEMQDQWSIIMIVVLPLFLLIVSGIRGTGRRRI